MYRMIYQPHLHYVYRELLERWRSRVMYRMIHQPHLRCVYRELQLSFISLLSLSLTYVGNILVRRYRPLTPLCALIFFRTYPGVPLFFFSHLPCCVLIFLRAFLLRTLRRPYFIFTYPAVPLFFFALTLLCYYFSSHLPCCALIFFSSALTAYSVRSTLLRLPCCAL